MWKARIQRMGIYAEVGKHLATLDLHQMRRQPIYAFFEEDSTLDCFPAWWREYLRYVHDEGDFTVPGREDE